MEMLIEKTRETYYEALQASSVGWYDGENNYEPFVKYYLDILLKAYNEFENRVERTLTALVKNGQIAKVGAGPSTGYVRI